MRRLQVPVVPEQSARRQKKLARYGNRILREAQRRYMRGQRNLMRHATNDSVRWVMEFYAIEEMLDWERTTLSNAI